jgi:tetratricopeptide (TPR) repeat protein
VVPQPELWIDEGPVHDAGPVRDAASEAVARGNAAGRPRRSTPAASGTQRAGAAPLPDEVRRELETAGGAARAPRLEERLASARSAFQGDRYGDARRILTQLAREAPGAPSVRELLGLTNYRLARWRDAARELEAFRLLTGSVAQHPVLADCYRALRRYTEAEALWEELKAASPSAELVAEGRIVAAGTRADRDDVEGAIALMASTDRVPARVRDHHLRSWYVLADLHERSGDLPRARSLFGRIARYDEDFADVAARLAALG